MRPHDGRRRPDMHRFRTLALLAFPLLAASCGEEAVMPVNTLPVQGAAIDGSDDRQLAELDAPETDAATEAGDAIPADPDAVALPEDDQPAEDAATASDQPAPEDATTEAESAPETDETDPVVEAAGAQEDAEAAEAAASLTPIPEPGEDGVIPLAFTHLSLEGEDVDNIIDYLLFPEEFEDGDGFEFPAQIKELDGKEITISGYMIPGRIRKNMVRDFMLVRDLAGCCFGGAPNPDEWIDVIMIDETEAEYLRYLPITVRGRLELIGDQDQEGYAVGVYRLKATWAGEAD